MTFTSGQLEQFLCTDLPSHTFEKQTLLRACIKLSNFQVCIIPAEINIFPKKAFMYITFTRLLAVLRASSQRRLW